VKKNLDTALLLGAIYFYIVALLHFIGFKIPVFFIYYNVDSTIYQDRIIAVLSFMFATFLFAGYKLNDVRIVKYILFAGTVGVFGLGLNNFLTRIRFRNNTIYWIEIGLLGLYVLVLHFLYKNTINNEE